MPVSRPEVLRPGLQSMLPRRKKDLFDFPSVYLSARNRSIVTRTFPFVKSIVSCEGVDPE